MNPLTRFRIGPRLGGAFAALALLLAAVCAVGVQATGALGHDVDVVGDELASTTALKELKFDAARLESAKDGLLLEKVTNGDTATARERFERALTTVTTATAQVGRQELSADERRTLEALQSDLAALRTTDERTNELLEAGRTSEAVALSRSEAGPLLDGIVEKAEALAKASVATADAARADATAQADRARTMIAVFGLAALVAAAVLAFLITRSITRPLSQLEAASGRAADGDLTVRIGSDARDEIGVVSRAFDAMVASIRDTVARVAGGATTLRVTAREVAQAAEQSGKAAGEIAEGVSQVALAGEESAEASTHANDATRGGLEQVEHVSQVMAEIESTVLEAAGAVESLGRRSEEIGQIVATIREIADQTNLLALNAAIEAARAGEQGRGFAVVADEVRKLAEQSQRAAGSISGMIAEIQRETSDAVAAMGAGRANVTGGAQAVAMAGAAFRDIGDGIERVASVSEENAASAQQVAAAAEEASASAEEVAAAANEISAAADDLAETIDRFRVE